MKATSESARSRGEIEKLLAESAERELLRFLTCGSVDDGKSTLIGRLLHDSEALYEDQLAAVRRDATRLGRELDLAFVVDGLQAEREQGITIDVAYRYFSTARRKFIIADTPGHEQYTRNMATGASTCQLAIILVDARNGVLDQTRRHAFIASLLGIRHLVVTVNKMDLVGWSEERFEEIRQRFSDFASKLEVRDIRFIPVSALEGDNVVRRSDRMPWYQGSTLLDHLETVHIASDRNLIDFRFPVQIVLRPDAGYRGYGGTIASGSIHPGDEVLLLPSGRRSSVRSIETFSGSLDEAFAGMSVTITLQDDIDVSRGNMIARVNNVPHVDQQFEAMIIWMSEQPLEPGRDYLLEQTTVQAPAVVTHLRYRINVTTLHREPVEQLALNEIGRVRVETPRLLAFDPYSRNRQTGAFILIDRLTNETVGGGMIADRDPASVVTTRYRSPDAGTNVRPTQHAKIAVKARSTRLDQQPFTIWLTGLPRSGKSSIAYDLETRLFARGHLLQVLDGEALRLGLSSDLGFTARDRTEHVRRTAEIARMSNETGLIVVVAMASPSLADREMAREIIGAERFVEVYCNAAIEVCEARDRDGLYERARKGELRNVTGIDSPYEAPQAPDVELDTATVSVRDNVDRLLDVLVSRDLARSSEGSD